MKRMDFTIYVDQLAQQLEGKDPSRLQRASRGSVVLVVDDQGARHRATIVIGEHEVSVKIGVHESDDSLAALVRGPLEAWFAYFHGGDVTRMSDLQFNGDVELLETVARLTTAKLSALDLRLALTKR